MILAIIWALGSVPMNLKNNLKVIYMEDPELCTVGVNSKFRKGAQREESK